mgnify:FL=1
MEKYIANADKGVDFTGGNPNWLGVRNILYKYIQKLLTGEKTPTEVAKELDREANNIIENGYAYGSLHE